MNERDEIGTKLAAARTRLLLEHPFIGALVMHLPLVAADGAWCQTIATDARAFYYNPVFIAGLPLAQTRFVLAHEVLHCALGHLARRSHRQPLRWDVACDHVVNLLLADEGLTPPPGALLNVAYRGLAAEEIYPLIPPDTQERSLDRHVFDAAAHSGQAMVAGGHQTAKWQRALPLRRRIEAAPRATVDSRDDAVLEIAPHGARAPTPPALDERERLLRLWQGRLAVAAQQTRHAGNRGHSFSRAIDQLLEPRLPWRALLARYMMSVARDDYSYERPSRREGAALLPRPRGAEVDLCIALDTSGSINDDELRQFAAEVEVLKGHIRARVTLHACDERLDENGPWHYASWEPLALPQKIGGGGGTSFRPVFEWIADRCLRPDLLLYFTDAQGAFPQDMPDYPVIWLVKGNAIVPWGQRIQLN